MRDDNNIKRTAVLGCHGGSVMDFPITGMRHKNFESGNTWLFTPVSKADEKPGEVC